MKPSGLTLTFLVVFMMALMYNSVEAAAKPDADAEAEALANAIATGNADAVAGILFPQLQYNTREARSVCRLARLAAEDILATAEGLQYGAGIAE